MTVIVMTTSNDASANGSLVISPVSTSTRSATPSAAALARVVSGLLFERSFAAHRSMPTALPVVRFLAQLISANPRPHPASRTHSFPERASAATRRSQTRFLLTRLDLNITAAPKRRRAAPQAAPILNDAGRGIGFGHARPI